MNIADNGGLRMAWLAFLAAAARQKTESGHMEQGYTPARQFFLAYAQNFCGSENPQRLRLDLQTDPHSPRQFRVW